MRMAVLYMRTESPRTAGRKQAEHLGNCSSDAVGEMHTSPQALWHLRHSHSAAECKEIDLLRSFRSQVCVLNRYLSCQESCSSHLL